MINFIITEFERGVASFKENLPAKCTRAGWPHWIWIHAPLHEGFKNNSEREKFNRGLEESARFHNDVSTLVLKKVWSPSDNNLFVSDCQRFMSEGFHAYWEAVNKTVWYCDSIVLKKLDKTCKMQKAFNGQKGKNDQKDQFRWKNPKFNIDYSKKQTFSRLPAPPQRKSPL